MKHHLRPGERERLQRERAAYSAWLATIDPSALPPSAARQFISARHLRVILTVAGCLQKAPALAAAMSEPLPRAHGGVVGKWIRHPPEGPA
jgi:hypothetical protein